MTNRIAVPHTRRIDDYLEAVRAAGAEPWVVRAGEQDVRDVLDASGGLLLTGGPDVHPVLYGEAVDPHCHLAEPGRDSFEIELTRLAIERDMPVLAICRGEQVLNVACGGTLIQHIPDAVPRAADHEVKVPSHAIAHDVTVEASSRLAALLGPQAGSGVAPRVAVNSRHHQAVKHVAPGLVVTATAEDGVIEAIERPGSSFCLGVQWHPENFWRSGEFSVLFAALARAARG